MELEKKRETKWYIKKKGEKTSFYLRSIEDSGHINKIGIGLTEEETEVYLEMNPEEFKNFYFILKSFKDLLYSEGLDILGENSGVEHDSSTNNSEDLDSLTTRELNSLEMKKDQSQNDENHEGDEVNDVDNTEIEISDLEHLDQTESEAEMNEENLKTSKLDPTDWDPW